MRPVNPAVWHGSLVMKGAFRTYDIWHASCSSWLTLPALLHVIWLLIFFLVLIIQQSLDPLAKRPGPFRIHCHTSAIVQPACSKDEASFNSTTFLLSFDDTSAFMHLFFFRSWQASLLQLATLSELWAPEDVFTIPPPAHWCGHPHHQHRLCTGKYIITGTPAAAAGTRYLSGSSFPIRPQLQPHRRSFRLQTLVRGGRRTQPVQSESGRKTWEFGLAQGSCKGNVRPQRSRATQAVRRLLRTQAWLTAVHCTNCSRNQKKQEKSLVSC